MRYSFYVTKVFQDYLTDKTKKTFIWAGAANYPVLGGYLRRDSGHHFQTDVICGYLAGALIGYFFPELHRANKNTALSFDYIYSVDQILARATYKF